MIKRTLEISREPAHLCVRHRQLQLRRDGRIVGTAPCEDVGVVMVDHPQTTYSHQALASLAEHGAAVVICGRDHLPAAIMLPVTHHGEGVWRINDQIAASLPLKKRLWQQLIVAKIKAQAGNLSANSIEQRRLNVLATQVRSGDPSNLEAQAAKVYWEHWLDFEDSVPCAETQFHRNTDGNGINACLNYGYAVLRAALGRAIVAAGLHPSLGIFHQNRSNAFCLADDLIEPFRPLVDRQVRQITRLFSEDAIYQLSQPVKAKLLTLLTHPMKLDSSNGVQQGPLMVMVHRMVASLVHCYARESKRLDIPTAEAEPDFGVTPKCESQGTE